MPSIVGRALDGIANALEIRNPCRAGTGKFSGNDHWKVVQVSQKNSGWVELEVNDAAACSNATQLCWDAIKKELYSNSQSEHEIYTNKNQHFYSYENDRCIIQTSNASTTKATKIFLNTKDSQDWEKTIANINNNFGKKDWMKSGKFHYDRYTDLLDTSTASTDNSKLGDLYNWGWNYDSPGISSSVFDPIRGRYIPKKGMHVVPQTNGFRRFKATGLFIWMPFYGMLTISVNLLSIIPKIIYHVGRIFYDYHLVRKASSEESTLDPSRFKSGTTFGKILQFRLLAAIKSVGRALANVIHAPYYTVGMMAGCAYTWFAPKNGNKLISRFENDWNHGISCADWLKGKHSGCFYQAPCMQILSDLSLNEYAEYRIRDESAGTWGDWIDLDSSSSSASSDVIDGSESD